MMKSRPVSDPTSWDFQANIHGTSASNPAWNQCEHGTLFFVSWHRMYLYYFERILRAASGDPNFALPYWNYSDAAQRLLPVPFRVPADASNSLFTPNRNSAFNNGTAGLSASATNTSGFMPQIAFNSMSSSMEGTPHGAVHVSIGGWMGSVPTAARDPIFWLHHGNIDRLWKRWIGQGGGRANPADAAWLNSTFSFFDENGTQVTLTGSAILDTVTQLNYRYDDDPLTVTPPWFDRWWIRHCKWPRLVVSRPWPIDIPRPVRLGTRPQRFELKLPPLAVRGVRAAMASKEPAAVTLIFEDFDLERTPELFYEVYLNLPENRTPDRLEPDDPHYIGNLELFGVRSRGTPAGHGHTSGKARKVLEASGQIDGLIQMKRWDGESLSLTFVPRALVTLEGKDLLPDQAIEITIGRLSIEVSRAAKQ